MYPLFIPMCEKQKLFSDVDILLRKYGFDLLHYEISPVQVGLKERITSWSFGPTVGFPERFGQPMQADAIFKFARRIFKPSASSWK